MNCEENHGSLLEVADGTAAPPPELERHLASCAVCRQKLAEMKRTMALLDEWQAPEPSPYFDVRLQARLREEQQRRGGGWLAWLRRPAYGMAATLLLVAGVTVGLIEFSRTPTPPPQPAPGAVLQAQHGGAVSDLQFLDKHSELLQDFDALDVLDDNGADDQAPQKN